MSNKINIVLDPKYDAEYARGAYTGMYLQNASEDIEKLKRLKTKHKNTIIALFLAVIFSWIITTIIIAVNNAWSNGWVFIIYVATLILGVICAYFAMKHDEYSKYDKSWFRMMEENPDEFKKFYVGSVLDTKHILPFLNRLIHNSIIQIVVSARDESSEEYVLSYIAESWEHWIVFDSLNRPFTIQYSKFHKEPTLELKDGVIYVPLSIDINHSDIYLCNPNYKISKEIEDV